MNLPSIDKLGRAFDPTKFRQKLDSLGRWVNARAGRRKGKPGKPSPVRKSTPETMNTDANSSAPETPANPAPAAETPAPKPGETFGEAYTFPPADPAAPAAPDFKDLADVLKAPAPAAGALPGEKDAAAEGEDTPGENLTVETIIGVIQTALVLIGDDEGILSPMEKRLLRSPLERVLKKYNVGANSLPPEADLAFAVASLVIVRIQKPKTATWFAKVKAWCVAKFFAHEGRKLANRVEAATS